MRENAADARAYQGNASRRLGRQHPETDAVSHERNRQNRIAINAVRNVEMGKIGAGDGIRTHDPNLGKVVLYP